MYTEEQLKKYPFFAKKLESTRVENILDPLMGILSRAYIIGFAQSLIEQGIPFTFAILDLDNFKFINDTYGHQAGDGVLSSVAEGVADYLDGYGLAGRFGGDEILIVNTRDLSYQEKKGFFKKLYADGTVVRRNVILKGCSPFITGTSGCATYPDDADNYDALFALIDKSLYRGKTKGRNCYIIYVETKHKDLEIQKLAKKGTYNSMCSLIRQFEMVPGITNKLHSVMPLLMQELQISDLYYVAKNGRLHAVRNTEIEEDVSDIGQMMTEDLFVFNSPDLMKKNCPVLYKVMKKLEAGTILVARVRMDNFEPDGYLICPEPRGGRIWQEEEFALMYFLAKLLAYRLRVDGEEIPG